jgi:uncharacterized protein (TIGR02466 family)
MNQVEDRFNVESDSKYQILRPFSCNIVKTVMSAELQTAMCSAFQQHSDDPNPVSEHEDNSYGLAGNMHKEFIFSADTIGDKTPLLTGCLTDLASQLYHSSINTEWQYKRDIVTPLHREMIEENLKSINLNVNIYDVWGNISVAGDFNPPHTHSRMMSGVGYFRLPDDIEQEWLAEDHDPSAGMLNFWDGRSQSLSLAQFRVKPKVGDIYIFPAWLNHSVHPFRSTGERWSFSFNCTVMNMNNDVVLTDEQKTKLRNENAS